MNKVALLGLALLFALCAGVLAEMSTGNLIYHAKLLSGGKPMPLVTEWIFQHIAHWMNGSVLCLFLLPWALLLSCATRAWPSRRTTAACSHCAFLTPVAIFVLSEMFLGVIFVFAILLPFVVNYRVWPHSDEIPLTACIPQFLLLLIFTAAVITPIIRTLRRPTNATDTAV
jgi:hypothetical protein